MIPHARVLIEKDNRILLIHRINKGREYYVLPGGHVESGEDPVSAAIREAKEETNLDVTLSGLLWTFTNEHMGEEKIVYVYKASSFSGNLMLNGPEKETESDDNQFIHEWIDISKIKDINLVPKIQKEKLIEHYNL